MLEVYFFKNWKVCLKRNSANTINNLWFRLFCVVRNPTYPRNMCTISISSMLCRPSFVELKDCTVILINSPGNSMPFLRLKDGFLLLINGKKNSGNTFSCLFVVFLALFCVEPWCQTSSCEFESGRLRIKTPTSFFVLLS